MRINWCAHHIVLLGFFGGSWEQGGTLNNCFFPEILCYTGIFHWILCFVMENLSWLLIRRKILALNLSCLWSIILTRKIPVVNIAVKYCDVVHCTCHPKGFCKFMHRLRGKNYLREANNGKSTNKCSIKFI